MPETIGIRSLHEMISQLQEQVQAMEPPKPVRRRESLNTEFIASTLALKRKKQEKALAKLKETFLKTLQESFSEILDKDLAWVIMRAVEFVEEKALEIANITMIDLSSDLKAQTCIALVHCVFSEVESETVFEMINVIVHLMNKNKPKADVKKTQSLFCKKKSVV